MLGDYDICLTNPVFIKGATEVGANDYSKYVLLMLREGKAVRIYPERQCFCTPNLDPQPKDDPDDIDC